MAHRSFQEGSEATTGTVETHAECFVLDTHQPGSIDDAESQKVDEDQRLSVDRAEPCHRSLEVEASLDVELQRCRLQSVDVGRALEQTSPARLEQDPTSDAEQPAPHRGIARYRTAAPHARVKVSCVRSSASARLPVTRRKSTKTGRSNERNSSSRATVGRVDPVIIVVVTERVRTSLEAALPRKRVTSTLTSSDR
jgi:hypothetical protein